MKRKKKNLKQKVFKKPKYSLTHTHTHIYIYIYIANTDKYCDLWHNRPVLPSGGASHRKRKCNCLNYNQNLVMNLRGAQRQDSRTDWLTYLPSVATWQSNQVNLTISMEPVPRKPWHAQKHYVHWFRFLNSWCRIFADMMILNSTGIEIPHCGKWRFWLCHKSPLLDPYLSQLNPILVFSSSF